MLTSVSDVLLLRFIGSMKSLAILVDLTDKIFSIAYLIVRKKWCFILIFCHL